LPLFFVSGVLAVDGASDGAAKLRLCQLVLPVLCSGDDGFVFSGAKRVSFFPPQIISGASVFVGDGSVGSCCFIPAKGCELPVIPLGGMWIPAVSPADGGGWSRRFLGIEDANVLSTIHIWLDGGSGSLSLAALHVVFFVEVCWEARRRAASSISAAASGRWKKLEEERFTNKSFSDLFVIFFSSQGVDVIWGCISTF